METGLTNAPAFTPKKLPQFLAVFTANIGVFALGTVLGWSSTSIPDIRDKLDLGDDVSKDMETWISSICTMGALVAGLSGGFLIQAFGRKWTMLGLVPPFLGGWVMVALAKSPALILAGRFITGFCGGAYTLAIPVYVSESVQDNLRGMLGNTLALFIVGGIFFINVIGSLMSWRVASFVCMIFPALHFGLMLFMPESPRYLLIKDKKSEAIKSLKYLRGAPDEASVGPEIKQMEHSIEMSSQMTATFKDLLAGPILKPTLISMTLMFLQQYGGINAVLFNSNDIFKAAGTELDSNICAIIIAGVQVVFAGVACLLVERMGRKILVVISDFGMGISLVALGVYFYLKEEGKDDGLGWLPLTSLVFYIITYNIGLGPLPWTMMGELLPPHVKGLTSALATGFNWSLAFIVTKTFEDLRGGIHDHGAYWLFAGISLAGGLFALLFVPETKGRSIDEIQRYFGASNS